MGEPGGGPVRRPPVWLWPKLRRYVLGRAGGRCECDGSCGLHGRGCPERPGPADLTLVRDGEGMRAVCPRCLAALDPA